MLLIKSEVSVQKLPELGAGWTYYGPTAREIRNCVPKKRCSAEERILGFCN